MSLGNGDGTFQSPVVTTLGESNSVAILGVGDFNGDGKLDVLLAVTAIAPMQVQVFLGNGHGGFTPGTTLPIANGGVVAGAFIVGGKLDVAAVTTSAVTLYPGVGDGTFLPPIVTPLSQVGELVPFVAMADTNHDGLLDIIAEYEVGDGTSVVSLFGNGAGSFVAGPSTPGQAYEDFAQGMTVADFNGDGNPDLVDFLIFNDETCYVRIFFGRSDGSFSAPALNSPTGFAFVPPPLTPAYEVVPIAIAAGLAQANGLPNLFMMQRDASLYEIPNTGNGVFGTPIQLVSGPVTGIANADFNGDGIPDIATANVIDDSPEVSGGGTPGSDESGTILLGNGDGTWVQPAANAYPGQISGGTPLVAQNPFVFADFNNDGRLDVLTSAGTLLLGATGTAAPQFLPGVQVVSNVGQGLGIAGDFNGDGILDFVFPVLTATSSGSLYAIEIGLGNGDGTFHTHLQMGPADISSAYALATGDLNNDGHLDLVELAEGNELIVWLGVGDGTFRTPVVYPVRIPLGNAVNPNAFRLALADFDGPGNCPEVVVMGEGGLAIFPNYGDGTLEPPITIDSPGDVLLSISAADVNGDGNADLMVGYLSYSNPKAGVAILLGNGDLTFQPATPVDVIPAATSTLFTDVNQDGYADLVGCGFNGDLGVAFGGPGGFSAPEQYLIGASCSEVYAGPLANGVFGIAALASGGQYFIPMIEPVSGPTPERRPTAIWFRR